MTYSENVGGRLEGLRWYTVAVLDELIAGAGEFELAAPPPALKRHRRRLRENACKVLVGGGLKHKVTRSCSGSDRSVTKVEGTGCGVADRRSEGRLGP